MGLGLLSHYSTLGFTADSVNALSIESISSSLKQWFIRSQHPQNKQLLSAVKHINSILSTGKWDSQTEKSLKNLNPTLTGQCISRVLKLQKDVDLGTKFFDWARHQNGYDLSLYAYYTFFKMLSTQNLLEKWLDSFHKQNLTNCNSQNPNPVSRRGFYCILIMGYSMAGKPDVVVQMLERIQSQVLVFDKFSCRQLLNVLAKENCFRVAGVIERRMPRRKFEVKIGSSIEIKSLCEEGKLEEAKRLLDEVKEKGFAVSEVAVVSLVSALSKQGQLDEAGMLVEVSRKGGLIPMSKVYETWIRCLVEENKLDEVLAYFEKRVSEGLTPTSKCYNSLLTGLMKNNRYTEFYSLLNEMADKEIALNTRTMDIVVCFFCKGKLIDVAIDLYNERSQIGFTPGLITHSKLIIALCSLGKVDEALKVLDEAMTASYFPCKHTLAILLSALCRIGKLDKVCELLNAGIERQCVPGYSTCSETICALSQAGRVDDGYTILFTLVKSNVFLKKSAYSALIDGFCNANRGNVASQLLLEMKTHGHLPGRRSLKSVICVLCETGYADQVLELVDAYIPASFFTTRLYNMIMKIMCKFSRPDIAVKVLEKMHENGCMPDAKTYTNLLYGYLKCRYVVNAVNLFKTLLAETRSSSKLYNIMVSGLCTIQKQDLALMYFDEMIKKGMCPNHGCYENAIHLLCQQGNISKALICFGEMKKKGYQCTTFVYNVLLDSCVKLGEYNQAWFIFENMRNQGCPPNVATFRILIAGLSKAKRLESAVGVLEDMMEQFSVADILIYNMLLQGLCKEGKIEVACALFSRMSKKGCVPNVVMYDCLIQGLYRADRPYDAQKLIAEMEEKKLHLNR